MIEFVRTEMGDSEVKLRSFGWGGGADVKEIRLSFRMGEIRSSHHVSVVQKVGYATQGCFSPLKMKGREISRFGRGRVS